jgi:hypothetical protein
MKKVALFFALIIMLFVIITRTFISGWGPHANYSTTGQVSYGIAYNPTDNLSYCSWAQQSMSGMWRFGDLYTTVEHNRLMFNSLFLLVGKLSALFSASPIFILNIFALLAVPLFVFCVARMCYLLELSNFSGILVICMAIGGGGISWFRQLVLNVGLGKILQIGQKGPDLFYHDLYPGISFFIYPYQSITVSVLSFLSLMIVQYDNYKQRLSLKGICLIVGSGLLLASIRPYEPLFVLVAYGILAAASFVFPLHKTIRRRRFVVISCLLVGILPMTIYSFWVSRQPVWSNFAKASLNLQTGDWIAGFFLLWILASIGCGSVLGARFLSSQFSFLALWSLACGFFLIILNSAYTKLSSGCTIPLAILSGLAIHKYESQFRAKGLIIPILFSLIFLSLASTTLLVVTNALPQSQVCLSSELFQAIKSIRKDAPFALPTVLTDHETGEALPGLGGFRVFCGHWSLTDDNNRKLSILARLGFSCKSEQNLETWSSGNLDSSEVQFLKQVKTGTFQYLMIRKDHLIYRDFLNVKDYSVIYDGHLYLIIKMSHEVYPIIEKRLLTTGLNAISTARRPVPGYF